MGKGSNTTSSNSTSFTAPDSQAAGVYRQLLDRASGVAATPYQAYSGPLTAFNNSQQNLGVAGINANANFASPYISQAAGLAGASAAPITASTIQQYQNPYTQQVVDATTAQMSHDNAQQMAQLQGNQIAQGALGGNATGVAKAILAGQQGRTMASTTANLYNQSYQQALDAAQRQQQTGLAGANALANYGISGQNAALQGASAQFGVGTQQQQTEQANLDRLYQQYAQAQAFPYQQAQWLAGMATGVGSNLGGTSTSNGQTTGPAPNSTAQWLGLGLSAASLLSDRNAKTDIEHIGKTHDGQNLYRYRYRGSPDWHIGPMAQEVDPEHRERGPDGLLYVDLKGATDDAVRRASGGGVEAPWAGVGGAGWIPQMGIHAGSGAPQAPGLMSPKGSESGGFDPSKLASGVAGAAKGLGSLDWGGAWNAGLGNLSGDAWGGGSFLGGGAYGGSSASPLPGLDASDYGVGFARGGGVAGYAGGGVPLYDDPGQPVLEFGEDARPEFDERFSGQPRLMPSPRTPVAEMGETGLGPAAIPQSVVDRAPGVVNPGEPVRMLGSTFGPNDQGAPVMAADDEEAPAAPGVAGRTGGAGRPPVMAFEDSEHYRRIPDAVQQPERRGFGLGLISGNMAQGLLAAGLGMMASRSPFLGTAVGEGGLAGLGAYASAEAADRKAAQEAQKLALEARQKAYDNWMGERKQSEIERHNKAVETKDFKPTWGVIDEDPLTGRKVYGWIDPNKMTTSRGPQGAGDKGSIAASLTGEEYLKELEKANPEMARTVKGVADYRINPASLSQRGGMREKVLERALRYNPDYDQTQFTAKNGARRVFASGPEGRTVRSLNVSIDHLETLEEAAKALNNGDIPLLNRIVNTIREKTGSPVTTNFDSIKQVVSAEIAKAVVGGQTALHDREDMAQRARNSQSPAQLMGIFGEFKKLMAGQMKGLRRQYESQTKLTDFDTMLEPGTIKALKGLEHGAPESTESGGSSSGLVEGRTGKKNGRPVIVKGGKLIYQDTGEAAQ